MNLDRRLNVNPLNAPTGPTVVNAVAKLQAITANRHTLWIIFCELSGTCTKVFKIDKMSHSFIVERSRENSRVSTRIVISRNFSTSVQYKFNNELMTFYVVIYEGFCLLLRNSCKKMNETLHYCVRIETNRLEIIHNSFHVSDSRKVF